MAKRTMKKKAPISSTMSHMAVTGGGKGGMKRKRGGKGRY